MKHLLVILLSLLVMGCATSRRIVPAGEVPQSEFVSAADEQFGQQVFNELAEQFPLSRDDAKIKRVRTIVDRITDAIGANVSPWHVNVLEGDEVQNAAATKGNFIFVWTGMLKDVQSDDELASVLAHEISHVLAGHTQPTPMEEVAEAMAGISGGISGQIVGMQTGVSIAAKLAEVVAQQAMQAIFVNPESRRKELEADQIGLFVMADAGYDPEAAVSFWKRMSETGAVDAPIAIISSHPQSAERFSALERLMPQAKARYELVKHGGLKRPAEWEAPVLPDIKVSQPEHTEKPFDDSHIASEPKSPPTNGDATVEWSSRVEKNEAGEWVGKQ